MIEDVGEDSGIYDDAPGVGCVLRTSRFYSVACEKWWKA
jgi:hypothetical protein